MYRSFVTCDDPKGVVEGKTIKKSKIDPRNIEDHKQRDSKDFAKDLLKGAFGLQESLVMLGKLQEASEYMTKLRKREVDETGVGRTESERVADRVYSKKVEFGKRSLSVDYSRDCYDELRDVIRDSLARQNLLPPSEKARYDRREVALYQDFPSTSFTSLSESSTEKACVVDTRNLVMSSPEFPSTSSSQFASIDRPPAKIQPKVPNLIARLMGLEEIPSTPLHQKRFEKDKVFKQRRPIFEIDLPKAKKLLPVSNQKVDPKRRTLDGIIETMQFKGLLRCKSNNVIPRELTSSADDAPPIVIMKPVYAPELQVERFSTSIRDENPPDTKDSFGKWNLKEEENSPVNFTIYRKMQTRKVQKSSCITEKGPKDHSEAPACRKTNEAVIPGKLPLPKNRASPSGRTKQPKKELTEKRVERTQRAPGAKKAGASNTTTKVQDQSKRTTAKVTKPERKSNAPEKLVASRNSSDSKRITAVASHNSTNRKKNVKTEKSVKSSSIVPIVENSEHNDDNIKIVHTVEPYSDLTITKVTSSEEFPHEEVAEISQNVVTESIKNAESSVGESTVPLIQCDDEIVPLMEHASYQIHPGSTEKENLKATTRHILLSNESFLSRAEELFDTDAWEPTVWKTIGVNNDEMPNSTLVLDCANELLENKRSQYTLVISKNPVNTSRVSISFDELLNEICDAIEVLKSYAKIDGNDSIYAVHERDLSCIGVVNTTWDLGWKYVVTLNEVEHIVTDIEKHVLNGIIDDVLTEFAPCYCIYSEADSGFEVYGF